MTYRPTLTYHGHALPDEPVCARHLKLEDAADAIKADLKAMEKHFRRCLGQRLRYFNVVMMAMLKEVA